MRRRSLIGIALALGLGTPLLAGAALAAEDARAVLDGYLAAWNAHDATRAAEFFADDVVYYDASVGTPIQGKQGAKEGVIDNFLNAAPDALWLLKGEPVVSDGKVAFEWEFSGTNTGAWADGTAPTNKPFKFTGASVMQVHDGKITLQSDYYDALGFYKQLGLM
ncbi:polyketide cyclase [Devosia sp. H5989]|nr:polyketide cyclase [Devosia sp. H5989]